MTEIETLEVEEFSGDPRDAYYAAAEVEEVPMAENAADNEYTYTKSGEKILEMEKQLSDKMKLRIERLQTPLEMLFIEAAAERAEKREALVKEICWYIPYLLLFVGLVVVSNSVEKTHFMSQAVGARLYEQQIAPISRELGPHFGKGFRDIHESSEFYLWAISTFVDMNYGRPDADTDPQIANNYVGRANLQFGAARFRSQRVKRDTCMLNDRWLPSNPTLFSQDCFGFRSYNDLNKTAMGPASNPNLLQFKDGCYGGWLIGDLSTYDCSGHIFDVSLNLSRTDVGNRLALMLPSGNFDGFAPQESTRLVSLATFAYNPATDFFALVYLWVEVSVTGAFVPGWKSIAFRVYSNEFAGLAAYTVIFAVVTVLGYFGWFVYSLVDAAQRDAFLEHATDPWTVLDFVNIVVLFVLLILRFVWWGTTSGMKFKMTTEGKFDDDLEYAALVYEMQTFCNAICTVLLFLRVLKFAGLSSRLSVINRTMAASVQNLLNLLVIFLIVLISYALTATLLFGPGMVEYSSFDFSMSSLLRMLLGDFDYDALKNEQWYLAALFFWSFTILGLFLLLNMMVAVIGDAFGAEQEQSKDVPMADELVDMVSSIGRRLGSFFSDPVGWIANFLKHRQEQMAASGKYAVLRAQLQAWRYAQPTIHCTEAQFAELSDAEKDHVKSGKMVACADLEAIIRDGEDGEALWEYLSPRFVEDFFVDAAIEHRYFTDMEVTARVGRRKELMKQAAIAVLTTLLGLAEQESRVAASLNEPVTAETGDELGDDVAAASAAPVALAGSGKKQRLGPVSFSTDVAANEIALKPKPVAELMAPTLRSLNELVMIGKRVDTVEAELATMAGLAAKLNALAMRRAVAAAPKPDKARRDGAAYRPFLRLPANPPPAL